MREAQLRQISEEEQKRYYEQQAQSSRTPSLASRVIELERTILRLDLRIDELTSKLAVVCAEVGIAADR